MEIREGHGHLELTLPAQNASVNGARRALEEISGLELHPETRYTLRLLVTELIANGIAHGGGEDVHLALDIMDGGLVHVEVEDHGAGFEPGIVSLPPGDSTSGRGLALVDALADRWGVIRNGGNRVWFELALR